MQFHTEATQLVRHKKTTYNYMIIETLYKFNPFPPFFFKNISPWKQMAVTLRSSKKAAIFLFLQKDGCLEWL